MSLRARNVNKLRALPEHPVNSRLVQAIPNLLSLLRLVGGLVFPWVPAEARLAMIVAALLTDLLDGELSRLLKADSQLGRVLDPVADKVFLLAVVGTLLAEQSVAVGEVLLVALRDVVVTGGAFVLALRDGTDAWKHMRARLLGKATTGLQFVFLSAVLFEVDWARLPVAILTAALGIASAIDYVLRYRNPR